MTSRTTSGVPPPGLPGEPSAWRVMVVDDESNQLEAIREILTNKGFEVLAFSEPHTALAHLEDSKQAEVDLLLSDLNMPGLDGVELVRQALQARPEMVALMMTGQGTVRTAVEAMKVGALDFVLKPFRISELLPVIHRALEMRRLRKENKALREQEATRVRQLEVAYGVIEAANKELDSFAARVAHDVRTPMSQMRAFANLLHDSLLPNLDDKQRQFFEYINAAGDQGDSITKGLLAFARLRDEPLTAQKVDLGDLVHHAQTELERGVGVKVAVPVTWKIGPLLAVQGDPLLLRQVVFNLMGNAVKYSSKAAAPCVQVFCEEPPGGLVDLHVVDNGAGFPMAKVSQLFLPFQRLHSSHDFPGYGFGLATVKRIVERHGGSVSASGEVGNGAHFTVRLPRAS